ncbi:hypothetical protein [Peribacillus sp. SCS-37]|uniref:hypothetical protein n=1 Tax=Paraperibacillus esterisolvens TaxID=3115296 RepID=UPI00390662F9
MEHGLKEIIKKCAIRQDDFDTLKYLLYWGRHFMNSLELLHEEKRKSVSSAPLPQKKGARTHPAPALH